MRNESLITISKRTGFSISTVSRVLSGQANKYRISTNTVELIKEEARRCNYTPSLLAKGLRMNKTTTIGLLIPSIENPYFANMAGTVIREARNYGYTVVAVDTMENEQNERETMASLLARKVDGILVVPCGQDPAYLEDINTHNIPIVLLDRYFNSTQLSYVCTDNFQGAFDATMYLINSGHKSIACIQGTPYSMPVKERARGYVEALKSNSLEKNIHIVGEDFSIQNGYLETKLVLSRANHPTAIFTMSNTILLGAIKAIKESGLTIPNDVSVISFDNNTFLDFLDPAISRVGQPIDEIGTLAVKLLIQKLNNPDTPTTQLQLPPNLIIRNSVANIL